MTMAATRVELPPSMASSMVAHDGVDPIVIDALQRVDVRKIYVQLTTRDAREVARARADPTLKRAVSMYDGAMKLVAQKPPHPVVRVEGPRERKRSPLIPKTIAKPKLAPKVRSREPSEFDLGPLEAVPSLYVEAQLVVKVDTPTPPPPVRQPGPGFVLAGSVPLPLP